MSRFNRWYFVCGRCEAKWFLPQSVGICPRCGHAAESCERILPPWTPEDDRPSGSSIEAELRIIRRLLTMLVQGKEDR